MTLKNAKCRELFFEEYKDWDFYKENEKTENEVFRIFMSVLSLINGNYEQFIKYSDDFCKKIGFSDWEWKTSKQQAVRSMMLVHGTSFYNNINDLSGMAQEYPQIMEMIFRKKASQAQKLHSLVWLNKDTLYELFKPDSAIEEEELYDKWILFRRQQTMLFLKNKWGIDAESYNWLKSIMLTVLGNMEGVSDIWNEYGLSQHEKSLLKAIWTRNIDEMTPLFKALEEKVS